jgi:hypothetical protein
VLVSCRVASVGTHVTTEVARGSEVAKRHVPSLLEGARTAAVEALVGRGQLESEIERALAASSGYPFTEHARAWSELEGLSLAFQFNRRSPLSAPNFDALHAAIGDAPAVPDTLPLRNSAALEAYRGRLGSARKLEALGPPGGGAAVLTSAGFRDSRRLCCSPRRRAV